MISRSWPRASKPRSNWTRGLSSSATSRRPRFMSASSMAACSVRSKWCRRAVFTTMRRSTTAGATEYICPPRLGDTRSLGVLKLAERAVRALGCSGACRVDVLVTEGENEYVLEVNTLPGMTPTSLLPKIAAHAGMSYGELCEAILSSAKLQQRAPAAESKRARRGDRRGAAQPRAGAKGDQDQARGRGLIAEEKRRLGGEAQSQRPRGASYK